ncbi:MarR family transcriptional regulator [Microbacterium sp. zg-Y818]|uniref:MarR family transcriptional regulator n=1 Tax=unclassified Microbacterium TaxID=2609290 RepID=UPI00214AA23F|nr:MULTISPECIES: MarR family transcriptional regulator [unclassified Microbacterium]MCR2799343.1 MarR family transcriptional regulator [Microbacterium sp. zg.Y818]WIM21343.1 MarR family transcriptional regulator [Microbacterium sp. zg-Y818]
MRSQLRHPVLDYFRILELRARSTAVRDRVAGETGLPLTPLDNAALVVVEREPHLTISRLAAATGVSVARASRQVARLEEFGLLTRTTAAHDARAAVLSLSAAGHDVRGRWGQRWPADYEAAITTLDPVAREALWTGVPRLHADLARQPELRGLDPGSAPTVDARDISALVAFAQWAAPILYHPSYARSLIERSSTNLSPQSLFVLRICAGSPQMDIGDLAASAHIDPSSVSRHVARLADDGLLSRHTNPDDGRSTVATATIGGRHVLQVIESLELAPIGRAMSSWEPAEMNATLSAVRALADGLYAQFAASSA